MFSIHPTKMNLVQKGTVLPLLFLLLTKIASTPLCPPKCSLCESDQSGHLGKAMCVDITIQNLPNSITHLHTSDGGAWTLPLGQLRSFVLAGKRDLEVLAIQRYNVAVIQQGIFLCCQKLTFLDLSKNQVDHVDKQIFEGLRKLKYLNLNQNLLTKIPGATFSVLVSVQELDLALNKLRVIGNESFVGLKSLTTLDLESNLIENIETDAFQDLQSVESINLRNNSLSVIRAWVFRNLRNLNSLNLQMNHLQYLDPQAMIGVNLEILNLAQNNINELPSKLLANISNMKLEINLARNQITEIHNGALSQVQLKTLYLVANTINLVQPEAFKDCFIEKLDLQQNKLHRLPDQLRKYLNQSTQLLLSNNPWSCDCNIQWLGSFLKNNSQDPVCAEPAHFFGWPIRLILNDLHVECNNDASIPVPTRNFPVPPRQDLITPLLQNQTGSSNQLDDKGDNSFIIIISVVAVVMVVLIVSMVTAIIYMSRSQVVTELTMLCRKPDLNYRTNFSQVRGRASIQI